ncbi:MAG: SDR family oxidoreductase [Thermoflexaceae bacterium]|nr:SDR family oxidoreductase [Thermoflexaceae bacterium]
MLETLRLEGRVAIVTGGGRGLGREMARSLSEAGADVVIASRTAAQLESTADFIAAATGRRPVCIPTNVQKSDECEALVDATIQRFGKLDIMVNNAGIGDRRGAGSSIWDLSDEDWLDSIQVNLFSTFYCTRAASRHMKARGEGGAILNVASGLGMRASVNSLAYGAAKAGVIALTKTTAAQLAGEGIRANCIVPGFLTQSPPETEEAKERIRTRGLFNPALRLGEAWEMGPLAVFLCSEASSYITGEIFVIDGGGLAGGIAPMGHTAGGPANG